MTAFAMMPPSFPDTVQALKELASGVVFSVGNINADLAPVTNPTAYATPAAEIALGVVSTGALQLLVLTQEDTDAAGTTAVETIFEGARGNFGP
jgi:hypothetical protein